MSTSRRIDTLTLFDILAVDWPHSSAKKLNGCEAAMLLRRKLKIPSCGGQDFRGTDLTWTQPRRVRQLFCKYDRLTLGYLSSHVPVAHACPRDSAFGEATFMKATLSSGRWVAKLGCRRCLGGPRMLWSFKATEGRCRVSSGRGKWGLCWCRKTWHRTSFLALA